MIYPIETTALILLYSVEFQGKEYKELAFRRPRGRDNLIANKHNKLNADNEVHLMAVLSVTCSNHSICVTTPQARK